MSSSSGLATGLGLHLKSGGDPRCQTWSRLKSISVEHDSMNDWPGRAAQKIELLRQTDSKLWIFGAADHFYRVGPTLCEAELQELERSYNVQLPDDYRAYINVDRQWRLRPRIWTTAFR